jgi:hypothetical protein
MIFLGNHFIKTLTINLVLLSLFACTNSNGDIEIEIQVYENDLNTLSPNPAIHKAKDVDFFKGYLGGTTIYSCIMYPFNSDSIQPLIGYQVYARIENNYHTATYKWISDSTLTFRLKNAYHKSETYTVIGNGGWTRLSWDD